LTYDSTFLRSHYLHPHPYDEQVVHRTLQPPDDADNDEHAPTPHSGNQALMPHGHGKSTAFTLTNKYIMQKGVAGRFTTSGLPGMATVYGDDLYAFDFNASKKASWKGRFRVVDYANAHALFHFTDGARLESREEGALDKLVLSGPNNGDDRW
jgi:hypothetical protein